MRGFGVLSLFLEHTKEVLPTRREANVSSAQKALADRETDRHPRTWVTPMLNEEEREKRIKGENLIIIQKIPEIGSCKEGTLTSCCCWAISVHVVVVAAAAGCCCLLTMSMSCCFASLTWTPEATDVVDAD